MQNGRTKRIATAAMLLLLAGMALFLAGCNSSGVGIFYSLENETKVAKKSNLSDKLTIGSMAYLAVPATYYIGAGKVYEATDNPAAGASLTWNAVLPPTTPDAAHVLSTQVAVVGSTLYAVYSTIDGTSSLLYRSTPTSSTAASAPWSLVPGYSGSQATVPDYTVQSIFAVNGKLFVSVHYTAGINAGLYALFQGGDTSSALVDGTGHQVFLSSPAVGGAYDGGTYWVAAGNQLYTGSGSTGLTVVSAANEPFLGADVTYRGISWSSTLQALFVSTSSGGLYAGKSGTFGKAASWPAGTTATGLDGFGEIISGTTDVIVVGADTGYYELDINPAAFNINSLALLQPGNTGTLSADVNYLTISLKNAHVIGFFGGTNRLFALTGAGLWRNEPNVAGTLRSWVLD